MPVPTQIEYDEASRILHVAFGDTRFSFSSEYLRVLSPSAEVRGHGKGQEKLVPGKRNVAIVAIEPVGQYAIKLVFDDGHDSGLFSWDYFWENGQHMERYWQSYLDRLAAAGESR